MKRFLALILGLMVTGSALAATPTPTVTPNFTPYVVGLAGFDLSTSTALPRHELGIPYWGKEGVFIYGQATETILTGQWVFLDEQNKLTLMDTTESGTEQMRVCVETAGATTTTPYVWVWCGAGVFEAIVVNAVSADSPLTTTATAGAAGTGGDAITGCINIDAGVTDTPVTVRCASLSQTNAP